MAAKQLAKPRQLMLRGMGVTVLMRALDACSALRSAGYKAQAGNIPSPAGTWADSVYVYTDAPMSSVRAAVHVAGAALQEAK